MEGDANVQTGNNEQKMGFSICLWLGAPQQRNKEPSKTHKRVENGLKETRRKVTQLHQHSRQVCNALHRSHVYTLPLTQHRARTQQIRPRSQVNFKEKAPRCHLTNPHGECKSICWGVWRSIAPSLGFLSSVEQKFVEPETCPDTTYTVHHASIGSRGIACARNICPACTLISMHTCTHVGANTFVCFDHSTRIYCDHYIEIYIYLLIILFYVYIYIYIYYDDRNAWHEQHAMSLRPHQSA